MATCTTTLTTDKVAISGTVHFIPLSGQKVSSTLIDTTPITATASGKTYTAVLQQNVKYYVKAPRFNIGQTFTTPASSTLDLATILTGLRAG